MSRKWSVCSVHSIPTSTFLDSCAAQLDDAESAPHVVAESARIKDSVHSLVGGIGGAFGSYVETWRSFEPKLSELISSDEFIARIDAVGKSLKADPLSVEQVLLFMRPKPKKR
jgi:hypothetical protein